MPLWDGGAWPGGSASTNTAPVAVAQSVSVAKNATSYAITLAATDADGNPLTYSIVANPSHGTLTGTAPNVTYIPTADYTGSDTFTFRANDGTADSNTATVSITVINTQVDVVPDPPTNLVSVAGNTQASVIFTPPVFGGTSAITGFTATANPGGLTQTGTGSPLTFTGLTNGTTYTITVVATNVYGNSAASSGATVVPISPPGIPPNPNAIPGESQNLLAWQAPTGVVTGYNAYWTSDGTAPTKGSAKLASISSGHIHSGLVNGTAYKYAVSAYNTAGESDLSAITTGTPAAPVVTPTAGLIAEYLFAEGTGTTVANRITAGTNFPALTLTGSPAWVTSNGKVQGIRTAAGKYAGAALSAATQITAWTMYFVVKADNFVATPIYQPIFDSKTTGSVTYPNTISLVGRNTTVGAEYVVNNTKTVGSTAIPYLHNLDNMPFRATIADKYWHIVTIRYDGSIITAYMDGALIASKLVASFTPELTNITLGQFTNTTTYFWDGIIAYAGIFNVEHTSSEIIGKIYDIRSTLAPREISLAKRLIIAEGDSITDIVYAASGGYPKLAYSNGFSYPATLINWAVTSSTMVYVNDRAYYVDTFLANSMDRNVLSLLIGRNDLSSDANAYYANIIAYFAARKAVQPNLKTVICTVLPSTAAGFDAKRNALNALIIANTGGVDVICRFDQVTNMGADGDAANTTYYSDGTHPTAAGQALLYPEYQRAVNSVLQ